MSPLTPCGPGELGPICDGPALVDVVTAVASPSPSVAAVVQAGEPSWYYLADVLGTWFGAIGTLLATGIAAWLGLNAVRVQNQQREEQVRAQAQRVTLVRLRDPQPEGPGLLVRNESDQLISAVRVVAVGAFEGEAHTIDFIHADEGKVFRLSGAGDVHNVAVVEFDDAAGRTWIRTTTGELDRAYRRLSPPTSLRLIYQADSDRAEVASIMATLRHGSEVIAMAGRVRVRVSVRERKHEVLTWRWRLSRS